MGAILPPEEVPLDNVFGRYLRARRESIGLTGEECSRRMGWSLARWSQLERGWLRPRDRVSPWPTRNDTGLQLRASQWRAMAHILRVDVRTLLRVAEDDEKERASRTDAA